jgi:molecular chaperone HtpG
MEKTNEPFKTEVHQILQMIIHSLYSHPEIFLRELISNASDALDKLKLAALVDSSLLPTGYEPEIRLKADSQARTLQIIDNGIGMTEEEVRENIGTIAHSGTKEFLKLQADLKQNPELIGQFGVGFYSAFMVADSITLETRRAGQEQAVRWESTGQESYSLEETTKESIGTTITLHLKKLTEVKDAGAEDDDTLADFTQEWVLRSTVKKHSDFISHPIKMEVSRTTQEGETAEVTVEDVTLNSQKALWLKPANEVTTEEYRDFYQQLSHDYLEPVKTIHFRGEGTVEFSALLYIPASRPYNFDYEDSAKGLRLYVKRVQIVEDCEQLLPRNLRFVRGIVDSSDLPLNVSREILQHDRQITQIRKMIVRRVLKALGELKEQDYPTFLKFWGNFGTTFKEGIVREPATMDQLLPLCLWHSTNSQQELTTLDDYVAKMPADQPAIYFMTGDSLVHISNSPLLERVKEKGYEVLLLVDPVDAFIAPQLKTYKEKKFQSVSAADIDIDSPEEKERKEEEKTAASERLAPVISVIKDTLKSQVKDVVLSSRLSSSPACLVSDQDSNAMEQMEQLYRQLGKEPPKNERTLELNPSHVVIEKMATLPKEKQELWSELLFDQSLIAEGSKVPDPLRFSKLLSELMIDSM